MKPITKDKIEQSAIEQLQSLGWEYVHGSVILLKGEKEMKYCHALAFGFIFVFYFYKNCIAKMIK